MENQVSYARLVAELEARKQIEELRSRYCWHVARGDGEKVGALFTEHCRWGAAGLDGKRFRLEGRAELEDFLVRMIMPGQIFGCIHNHVIVVDGGRAHGTCVLEVRRPDPELPFFAGYYHDRFERQADGRWLFAERDFYRYFPSFERSGLYEVGAPETGLAKQHDRKAG